MFIYVSKSDLKWNFCIFTDIEKYEFADGDEIILNEHLYFHLYFPQV